MRPLFRIVNAGPVKPESPEIKDAARLYEAAKARHEDLVTLLGPESADEIVGQAAAYYQGQKMTFGRGQA